MNSSQSGNANQNGAAGANGAPSNGVSNRPAMGTRTASVTETAPLMSIPDRNGRTTVEARVLRHWDRSMPKPENENRDKWYRAAKRWEQLEKFNLLYRYSSIEDTEIRLLYINPATKREKDLIVSIYRISDHQVGPGLQEYEALSYHWGSDTAHKPVYLASPARLPEHTMDEAKKLKTWVPDWDKGQRLYVRPNLDSALRYLRHQTHTVILWVDAICINQPDVEVEKPAQIAKMTKIYNKAKRVCIWLGDGKGDGEEDRTEDFYAAMKFSERILNLKDLEKLSKDKSETKRWSDLLDLMRCSWFSRRWVIQELALARDAYVHCGKETVNWQDFADAIGLFVVKFDNIRALFKQSQDYKIYNNYKSFSELEPLGAKVLVDAITNTFRKSVDGNLFEPIYNLDTLVSTLSTFESSDPRDTIFALLNIARESLLPATQIATAVRPPRPDYEKNLLEVYTDFLEWVVHSSESIDIICRQWAIPEREKAGGRKNPTELVKLPSWVQTISKSPYGTQEQGFNGRINGDSLVGRAGRKRYNASYGKRPEVVFGQRRRKIPSTHHRVSSLPLNLDGKYVPFVRLDTFDSPIGPIGVDTPAHELRVKGVKLDSIAWTSAPVSKGVITEESLLKGGWNGNKRAISKVPDKLWRTLVADRSADGENPPPWYHRAALHCITFVDNNGNISTRELLIEDGPPGDRLPQIVADYLKRVQAVTWNRRFLEGAQKVKDTEQLFGLGPPDTRKDDCICILFGCSVPCILRPCTSDNGSKYFHFVGEAYIYGRMDGEAITMLTDDELKRNTVEFLII